MKTLHNFIYSILAGLSISLGCMVNLVATKEPGILGALVGAVFFATGLFCVLVFRQNLYTGKVGYLCAEGPKYLGYLGIVWGGNLVGCALTALLTRATSLYEKILPRAEAIVGAKTTQGYLSAFVMAIFCGFIIYLAVENYKYNAHECGKYVGLLLIIPLFILCGFEHCVANMYYFLLTDTAWVEKLLYTLVITVGNGVGSILLDLAKTKLPEGK